MEIGHHCELYDSLGELYDYPPERGLIIMKDATSDAGGIVKGLARLEEAGIWLSVVAVGETPLPGQIVDAIKAGALDYLSLPLEANRLARCLLRTVDEAKRTSSLRRRKIEVQELSHRLSIRKAEALDLLASGLSNKLIARELGITPRTVEIHRANMMNKLGATHAASAVRIKLESEHAQLA